eukprot:XP_011535769.1 sperm acrosome-associated protein 7 isoform X2 [Homo sapiens]
MGNCQPSERPSPSAGGSMAVSQGDGTLCFVLLLCCWQETELRPRTVIPDEILVQEILDLNKTTPSEMPSTASTLSTPLHAGIDENYQAGGSENYHELLENLQFSPGIEVKISNDEANANANLHGDPSENYRGPQVSPGSEKSVSSKADGISLHTELPGVGRGVIPALSWPPQLAPMLGLTQSPTAAQTSTVPELIQEKNSKNTQYENLSILDQILQNIGRSSGNIFHKEQQRTSAQRRSQGSQ